LDTGNSAPAPLLDVGLYQLLRARTERHSVVPLPAPRTAPVASINGVGGTSCAVQGVVSVPVSFFVDINGSVAELSGTYDMWLVRLPARWQCGIIFSHSDLQADGPAGRLFSLSTGPVAATTFLPPTVQVPHAYRERVCRTRPPTAPFDPSYVPPAWLQPLLRPFTSDMLCPDLDADDATFIGLGPAGTRPVLRDTSDPAAVRAWLRKQTAA